MGRRYLFAAVFVALLACVARRLLPLIAPTHHHLPNRLQDFLREHGLLETFDADMACLAEGPRPGQLPDAPTKRHPVVMVPGITSCGLEVWQAKPCLGDGFFRRRLWGELSMVEAILKNFTCWLEHFTLDPVSGVDVEGVRLRTAKGLRSADYFMPGYWIWAKLIQNLGDIGYDEEELLMECYDWRLAFPVLETRDRRLTAMRHDIEGVVSRSGEKAVVLAHSMGANLWVYFMNWVESSSPGWTNKHIATFVSIGGAFLGAMGPLAAFLSGEMQATATLGPFNKYTESMALSGNQARDVYWATGGLGSLLPIGGSAVWGSNASGWTDSPVNVVTTSIFDDSDGVDSVYRMLDSRKDIPLSHYKSWTSYDRGVHRPDGGKDPRRFGNALASALPNASEMKIFCLYGVGLPTERAYQYHHRQVQWTWDDYTWAPGSTPFTWSRNRKVEDVIEDLRLYEGTKDASRPVKVDVGIHSKTWKNVSAAIESLTRILNDTHRPEDWLRIDTTFSSHSSEVVWGNGSDGLYSHGVSSTDGDGTVPLLSLGYMCGHGWRDLPALNPSKVHCRIKEYTHNPTLTINDPRGGPYTGKHVELIGNIDLIRDVLRIVSGDIDFLREDRIISNLTKIGHTVTERLSRILSSDD